MSLPLGAAAGNGVFPLRQMTLTMILERKLKVLRRQKKVKVKRARRAKTRNYIASVRS